MLQSQLYRPIRGGAEKEMRALVAQAGLRMDRLPPETLLLYEADTVVGTASRDGDVLRYIAVDPAAEGSGACARMVSELVASAASEGITDLFLYTKPTNIPLFASLGFTPLAQTPEAALMENRRDGVARYVAGLPRAQGRVGAVVMHANPFTNGHLYLCEQAAARCDFVYAFVLSTDASRFSTADRLAMARAGTAHLPNVHVCAGGRYMVSSATFPLYFIKDPSRAAEAEAALDATLFASVLAPALGIQTRFVGTEPFCALTRAYNARLAAILPAYGVELATLPRREEISASEVRRCLDAGDMARVEALVPPTTYAHILGHTS